MMMIVQINFFLYPIGTGKTTEGSKWEREKEINRLREKETAHKCESETTWVEKSDCWKRRLRI
jgi:hypothetical protein